MVFSDSHPQAEGVQAFIDSHSRVREGRTTVGGTARHPANGGCAGRKHLMTPASLHVPDVPVLQFSGSLASSAKLCQAEQTCQLEETIMVSGNLDRDPAR